VIPEVLFDIPTFSASRQSAFAQRYGGRKPNFDLTNQLFVPEFAIYPPRASPKVFPNRFPALSRLTVPLLPRGQILWGMFRGWPTESRIQTAGSSSSPGWAAANDALIDAEVYLLKEKD
jgi:hypothetical protein